MPSHNFQGGIAQSLMWPAKHQMTGDFLFFQILLSNRLLLRLYSPLLGPGRFLNFLILYTVSLQDSLNRGSARRKAALPAHRATQTQNKRTQYIHAWSGIRIHNPSVRATEDSSCLRPRGHCYLPFSTDTRGKTVTPTLTIELHLVEILLSLTSRNGVLDKLIFAH
jgi:hypothetical protein